MLARILPPAVHVVESRADIEGTLFPQEAAVVARAVEHRHREFVTVRVCARAALSRLGVAAVPILPGQGGAPIWPPGVVGSMTHCVGFRAAAVASSSMLLSVGIDAEPDEPLPAEVASLIASPQELAGLPRDGDVSWDRVLFSAKEAAYKAWFPLTGRFLDHGDVRVRLRPRGSFTAWSLVPVGGLGAGALDRLDGRWLVSDGLICTAVAVPTRGGSASPEAAQLMEEAVGEAKIAGSGDLLIDQGADGEVEDAEAERGEDDRLIWRDLEVAGQHVGERAGEEVTVSGQLLGEMR